MFMLIMSLKKIIIKQFKTITFIENLLPFDFIAGFVAANVGNDYILIKK